MPNMRSSECAMHKLPVIMLRYAVQLERLALTSQAAQPAGLPLAPGTHAHGNLFPTVLQGFIPEEGLVVSRGRAADGAASE